MKKNICIIHFNTPVLTRCLVQSINKYTPGANIYIFDNSDKNPFINVFDNVTVLDNTKGQLVDFNEVLAKFPMREKSRGKTNGYGSAKHSISIQKCVELIDDGFILLDSDVLLKRDISPVWNEKYVWVAGVEDWQNKTLAGAKKRKRVCPFLLYMNTKKMKEHGIAFYNDTHMLGFNNGPKCEEYETGVWFYEATPKDKRKIINYSDYIIHFRAGSWLDDARTKQHYKQMDPKKWLTIHKKHWAGNLNLAKDWYEKYEKNGQIEKDILVMKKFNDLFDHIYCLHYLPDEQKLPKLKEELFRVGIDDTAEYFSWVYDYPSTLLNNIYTDLNISTELNVIGREHAKNLSLKHYEMIKEAYELGYKRILIMNDNIRFYKDLNFINKMLVNMPDTDVVMLDKMVCSKPAENLKYKQYIKTLPADALYGDMGASNVFFIFTSCYALNRKAMERIIKLQEEKLLPADTPLNDKELTGSFAITNLAIQNTENYNVIGLDSSKYNLEAKQPEQPKRFIVQAARIGTSPINKTIKRPEPGFVPKKEVAKPRTLEQVKRPVSKKAVLPDKKIPNVLTRRIPARGTNKLYEF